MAERSGFYNANKLSDGSYDRTYDASDFADYFSNFIGNGVYAKTSDQLKVIPNSGLSVKVKTGKAFIDGYWYTLDEDKVIQLNVNSGTGSSNTVIVAELNKTNREIIVKAREFVSSVYPISTTNIHELVLAIISNKVGTTTITEGDITDTRFKSEYCGLVTGLIKQLDIGTAYSQLEAQFNEWFNTIQGKLTSDVAGSLQTQINELEQNVEKWLKDVKTQILGKTAVVRSDVTSNGGAYASFSLNMPSGFTSENCYVKSCMAKMVSGTGFKDDWVYGAEVSNLYTVGCSLKSDNTILVGLQGNPTGGIRGNLKLMVVLEKVEE